MTRRSTMQEAVAGVMAVGLDHDPKGLDTPLEDVATDTTEPTVAEKPEDGGAKRADASDRGAVGRLVAELLADPDLSYEAIVDRVIAAHPTAATTARSVASTACVMRKKGANVPVRRHAKRTTIS